MLALMIDSRCLCTSFESRQMREISSSAVDCEREFRSTTSAEMLVGAFSNTPPCGSISSATGLLGSFCTSAMHVMVNLSTRVSEQPESKPQAQYLNQKRRA